MSSISQTNNEIILSVKNLKKSYKRWPLPAVDALKELSFEVKAGTITGFLGANGAGKTTTIKCLLELAFADSGEVFYFGQKGLTADAKKRIGFLPERPYFYEYLTGTEFLKFYSQLAGLKTGPDLNKRIEKLLERVGLANASNRPLRGYSKGMLQRIGIAQALVHKPDFIILDEPMTGLDPDGRMEVREIILETAKEGTAVFFSSHLLPDAEQLCENLVILKKGDLIFSGKMVDLLNRVDHGYSLQIKQGQKIDTLQVSNIKDLQIEIDKARKANFDILEIKPKRLSLEEAFVQIAFDRKVG